MRTFSGQSFAHLSHWNGWVEPVPLISFPMLFTRARSDAPPEKSGKGNSYLLDGRLPREERRRRGSW